MVDKINFAKAIVPAYHLVHKIIEHEGRHKRRGTWGSPVGWVHLVGSQLICRWGPIFFPSHLVWGPAKRRGAITLGGGVRAPMGTPDATGLTLLELNHYPLQ